MVFRRKRAEEPANGVAQTPEAAPPAPAEQAQLDHILEAMSEAVLVVEASGQVGLANPATKRVLGVESDSLVGAPLRRAIGSAGLDRVIAEAAQSGAESADEVELMWPTRRQLSVSAAPMPDGDGRVVVIVRDVTEARRLDRIRRDFVANVSHELKTPVSALMLLAESLRSALDDEDKDAAERFADRLVSEAERLRLLSSDLLTLSRVESLEGSAGEPVDLALVVVAAAERSHPIAEAKGVALAVDVEEGLPPALGGQEDFEQLAANLIDNAVRYTDVGSVKVSLERGEDPLLLTVKDTGVGIPAKDLNRVFERFYRVEKSRSRHTGGTGLGLSIVRHVCETYGLDIGLESTEDSGTTVTIAFPTQADDPDTRSDRP